MNLCEITWLNNVKYITEFLYFVSGVAVAFGVWFSVCQYFLTKKDINTKYFREINSKNAEQIKLFLTDISQDYEKLKEIICTTQSPFHFENGIHKIEIDNENIIKSSKEYYENLTKTEKEKISPISETILTNLQLFSIPLHFGTSDVDAIEEIVSEKYLEIFETIFPMLMQKDDKTPYQPCIILYNKWRIAKKQKENKKEKEQLQIASESITNFKVNRLGSS